MPRVDFKLLSELVRRSIRGDQKQSVAVQYLGQSIDPDWPNGELIFVFEPEAPRSLDTIFVFSGGEDLIDAEVAKGVLDANPGARVVLVQSRAATRGPDQLAAQYAGRFLVVSELSHPKETAIWMITIATTRDLRRAAIIEVAVKFLRWLGFRELPNLDADEQAFIATGARASDNVVHAMTSGWRAIEFKSPYPVLRDLSGDRGIILQGVIDGKPYTLHRSSKVEFVAEEIRSADGLLSSLSKTLSLIRQG